MTANIILLQKLKKKKNILKNKEVSLNTCHKYLDCFGDMLTDFFGDMLCYPLYYVTC